MRAVCHAQDRRPQTKRDMRHAPDTKPKLKGTCARLSYVVRMPHTHILLPATGATEWCDPEILWFSPIVSYFIIHINVSNAYIDMNSVTKTSSGNPEIDGLSLHQAFANELDESPVKKRKVHCYQSCPLGCSAFWQNLPLQNEFF